MNDKNEDNNKLIKLGPIIKAKREEGNTIAILKNSRRVATGIEQRKCIICKKVKMCVNKTGLCAACYLSLTLKEKKIADDEARHKRIEFKVLDDRWDDRDEH
ncbi:MAG: hypothetical protein U9R17_14575 [Thermodesulfobacteriota bacterium]|nr:hypothetical protein [Thermodesulfobacteriota bacterium]